MGDGFRLGIDFGTWNTSAFLRWPDGHTRPLLFDGSPLLPSAVYAESDGRLLVGRDAVHAARLDPARLEPNPKRRFDRGGGEKATVRLGDQEVALTALVAAVLGRVGEEAVRVAGVGLGDLGVTLTHPAGWDDPRTGALREAGRRAGLREPRLVAEPVAAAGYFVSVLGRSIPAGSALVVYDFGAGTFDASVVVPSPDDAGGYRVLAVAGLADVGGVDLDAALLRHVARTHHDADPEAWQRLAEPQTPADRRHRRHLVEDVRAAKEMLSRASTATVPVPLLELEARVSRDEFNDLARPYLTRTVGTTAEAIAAAGLSPDRVAAVLLVGGSSRIPLVAELLRDGVGQPSTMDQPETVVAEGSLRLASGGSGLTRPGGALPMAPHPPTVAAQGPTVAARAPTVAADAATVAAQATPQGTPAAGQETTVGRGWTPAEPPTAPPRNPLRPVDPWLANSETVESPAQRVPSGPAGTLMFPQQTQQPPQPPPARATAPASPPPMRTPPRPTAGKPAQRRKPRRWPTILAVAVAAAITAAGTIYGVTYLTEGSAPPNAGATTPPVPYVRTAVPFWLPAGWAKVVDDESKASIVPGPATNGGNCVYQTAGVVRVTRDSYDVSGCVSAQFVKDLVISDSAAEATFSAQRGCGGMWLRTGHEGYFVSVCADSTVTLYRLGDDPPSDATRIGGPWKAADPRNVVVGFIVTQVDPVLLTVYVDRVRETAEQTSSTGTPLRTGRVGIGGFAPHPDDAVDVTIKQYRVWTPA
jgi:hypothetical protein